MCCIITTHVHSIFGNVYYWGVPNLDGGTYLGHGLPTLDGGTYFAWGTYIGWRYLDRGVPTLDWGYLP